jgi:glutamate N-acetyltransferase/amino-acid N-acetyltransferase
VDLYLLGDSGNVCFCLGGRVQEFDEGRALEILTGHDVRFTADMHMGSESAVAWGCDLTYDYVKINGDYRS